MSSQIEMSSQIKPEEDTAVLELVLIKIYIYIYLFVLMNNCFDSCFALMRTIQWKVLRTTQRRHVTLRFSIPKFRRPIWTFCSLNLFKGWKLF